jgi:hypothetical protein
MLLATAVRRALADLDLPATDRAAAELAMTYARAVDSDGDLSKLGPPLLATLEALGMTPRARAAVKKVAEVTTDAQRPASPLDELRARRAARTAG